MFPNISNEPSDPNIPNMHFGAYFGAPNMIKWGVPEKILQNAVQTIDLMSIGPPSQKL